MHHYESECHAKRVICYFQGQGHCKSSYNQIMTISTLSFELLVLLLSNLVWQHYHKPECFMEKLDCCVQGHGHSKISKCKWTFVQKISSESLNLLLPKLVWWCIIMSQIVFQKDWFSVCKINVTLKDNIIKILLFNTLAELLIFLQLNMVSMAHHHGCVVKRLDCPVMVKIKVTEKVQNSSKYSSGRYLFTCWTSCNQTWYGDATSWA